METPDWTKPEHTGTINVAVECADGVVIAVDSRTTAGSIIHNNDSHKIERFASNCFAARCGTSAHTQTLAHYARYIAGVLDAQALTESPRKVSIVSNYLGKLIQANKDQLSGAFVVGGVDANGPQVYCVEPSGAVLRTKFALHGSGSSYIMALADEEYREGMTLEEATKFAIRMVACAISRDGACGGSCHVVQIKSDGEVKHITVRPSELPVKSDIVKT